MKKAEGLREKCMTQCAPSVGKHVRCLSSLVKIDLYIAESATGQRDLGSKENSNHLELFRI